MARRFRIGHNQADSFRSSVEGHAPRSFWPRRRPHFRGAGSDCRDSNRGLSACRHCGSTNTSRGCGSRRMARRRGPDCAEGCGSHAVGIWESARGSSNRDWPWHRPVLFRGGAGGGVSISRFLSRTKRFRGAMPSGFGRDDHSAAETKWRHSESNQHFRALFLL